MIIFIYRLGTTYLHTLLYVVREPRQAAWLLKNFAQLCSSTCNRGESYVASKKAFNVHKLQGWFFSSLNKHQPHGWSSGSQSIHSMHTKIPRQKEVVFFGRRPSAAARSLYTCGDIPIGRQAFDCPLNPFEPEYSSAFLHILLWRNRRP